MGNPESDQPIEVNCPQYLYKLADEVIESYQQYGHISRQWYLKFLLGTILCAEDVELGILPEVLDYSPGDRLNNLHDEVLKSSAFGHNLELDLISDIHPAQYTTQKWRNISRLLSISLYYSNGRAIRGSINSLEFILKGLATGAVEIRLSKNYPD